MNKESLLMMTLTGKPTDRPPVWFMRQAGRVLPSYNLLKNDYTFWQLMQLPEIAAKVTMLPVEDLGVDAAILFSDILVIPYAMGMGLDFTDKGPVFDKPLCGLTDPMLSLHPDPTRLHYIYDVIDKILIQKPKDIPLIGFCGAPMTVLCYMLQGLGKNPEFPEAVKFMYQNKKITKKLIDAITEMSIIYALQQIKHGAEVFQLFESHAGLVPSDLYEELFLPSVVEISRAIRQMNVPFIYFPKGMGTGLSTINPNVCDFLSIDWQIPLDKARSLIHPEIGLQGNLDPRVLYADRSVIESHLESFLEFGKKNQNWIFNLGHGLMPGIPFENIKFVVNWVKKAPWGR